MSKTMWKRPTLRTFFFILGLLASLGINIGLIGHLSFEWRQDHALASERQSAPERLAARSFLDGSCRSGFSIIDGALEVSLAERAPNLTLSPEQLAMTEALLLSWVEKGCELGREKRALAEAFRTRPLQDPARAQTFIQQALAYQARVSENTATQIEQQQALLASFAPEQLAAVPPRLLPTLIPGFSLRQVLPRRSEDAHRRASQQASP